MLGSVGGRGSVSPSRQGRPSVEALEVWHLTTGESAVQSQGKCMLGREDKERKKAPS